MVCVKCYVKKVEYTVNGKMLCLSCFNEENRKNSAKINNSEFKTENNSEIKNDTKDTNTRKSHKGFSCPECGFFEEDFIKTGFVGCEQCYVNFKSIDEQINLYQGNNMVHRGK